MTRTGQRGFVVALTSLVVVAGAAAVATITVTPSKAQDSHLSARLEPETAGAVQQLVDSADRAKLPGTLIADKALEFQAKGASDEEIIEAARHFEANLGRASAALGERSTTDELRWGATALEASLPSRELARLRTAAPRRSLATALIVECDLITAGVPVGTSSELVVSMLRAGVRDPDLLVFQQDVTNDIGRGLRAPVSAAARARGAIDQMAGRSGRAVR